MTMLPEVTETEDRWIFRMRDYVVTEVIWGERVVFELSPVGRIAVGQDTLLTRGFLRASQTHVPKLSEFDPSSLRNMIGARLLSTVGFKDGGMRIILSNGGHLNLPEEPALPALIEAEGSILWPRPSLAQPH